MTVERGNDTDPLEPSSPGVAELAREIAARRTGMPAYLVDDETWAAAVAEAEEKYRAPEPLSPLADAVRRAQGRYNGEEVERMILATHPPGCRCRHHGGDR